MSKVEFFFDCSSPWTYLAFCRIQGIIKETNTNVLWRPILVGGVFNEINKDIYEARENPNPVKFKYLRKDLQDWADSYSVIINWPEVFPLNAVNVMRAVLVAEKFDKLVPYSFLCFEEYWSKGVDISDLDILCEMAYSIGIDRTDFKEKILRQETKDLLRKNTSELIERGGFGSPTVFINTNDMYFGNDRLGLVKQKILRHNNN